MAVVSLNLTDQAYSAYKQIPKGSRSRILSEMIAQRDFQQGLSGQRGTLMGPNGILEDMNIHTAGEAIVELKKILDRRERLIARLTEQEVIE